MAEFELRANSVRLRFERGSPEPSDSDIFAFMKTRMDIKCEKVLSMYKDKNDVSVIIKFKTEEDMKNTLLNLPDTMEFAYSKYQSATVKLSPANAVVRYVRLFNLPPEIEDREIAFVLGKYGKIIRMVREKYGEETGYPIWTSVRGVYLELKDKVDVPSLVNVRNIRARVFYEGLVNKCYQCGSADHLKAECPQKKSVNDRLERTVQPSYSGIVANGNRWVKHTTQNMQNMDTGLTKTVTSMSDTRSAGEIGKRPASTVGIGVSESIVENRYANIVATTTHKEIERSEILNQHVMQGCDGGQKSSSPLQNASGQLISNVDVDGGAGSMVKEQTKVSGKSSSKRGHKSRNKEQNTNEFSDSENSNTDIDQQIKSNTATGVVLSDALDRLTRSKTKQMKLSKPSEPSGIIDPKSDAVENVNEGERNNEADAKMSDDSL